MPKLLRLLKLNSQSITSGDKGDEHEEDATSYSSKWKRGYVFSRPNFVAIAQ